MVKIKKIKKFQYHDSVNYEVFYKNGVLVEYTGNRIEDIIDIMGTDVLKFITGAEKEIQSLAVGISMTVYKL